MRSIAERIAEAKRNSMSLNPLLFDEEDNLKPEIRDRVKEIVKKFLEYIQVDIRVIDIRLVGSNAAYNYTPNSDLDIHIVTDLSEISDPEVIARLYFDAIKKDFKEAYDIKIKGIEVEMYIEDINTSAVSNGIYSITQDTWIKEPEEITPPSDEDMEEAEAIAEEITDAMKSSKSIDELQSVIDRLYLMRKDSLSKNGEYSAGNLAFKILRNRGVLDKVKQLLRDATAEKLSLESKDIKEGI